MSRQQNQSSAGGMIKTEVLETFVKLRFRASHAWSIASHLLAFLQFLYQIIDHFHDFR